MDSEKNEANDQIKDQLKTVMGQLKTGLKASFSRSSPEKDDTDAGKQPQSDSTPKNRSATPGLDLLAEITGTPRKHMDNNYPAVGQALKAYLTDLAATFADGVSGEPERQDSARKRMNVWGKTLRKHGIQARDIKKNRPPPPDDPENHPERNDKKPD